MGKAATKLATKTATKSATKAAKAAASESTASESIVDDIISQLDSPGDGSSSNDTGDNTDWDTADTADTADTEDGDRAAGGNVGRGEGDGKAEPVITFDAMAYYDEWTNEKEALTKSIGELSVACSDQSQDVADLGCQEAALREKVKAAKEAHDFAVSELRELRRKHADDLKELKRLNDIGLFGFAKEKARNAEKNKRSNLFAADNSNDIGGNKLVSALADHGLSGGKCNLITGYISGDGSDIEPTIAELEKLMADNAAWWKKIRGLGAEGGGEAMDALLNFRRQFPKPGN